MEKPGPKAASRTGTRVVKLKCLPQPLRVKIRVVLSAA